MKGLGEKAKKALLRHVGNLAAIRTTDDATLLAVPGVTARHVKALRAAFPGMGPAASPTNPPTKEGDGQPS